MDPTPIWIVGLLMAAALTWPLVDRLESSPDRGRSRRIWRRMRWAFFFSLIGIVAAGVLFFFGGFLFFAPGTVWYYVAKKFCEYVLMIQFVDHGNDYLEKLLQVLVFNTIGLTLLTGYLSLLSRKLKSPAPYSPRLQKALKRIRSRDANRYAL